MNSVLRTFLFAAVSLLASVPALAQYPTKPIHIVVPYLAGGGTDIVARLLAGPLREMLGKPVIVDNKPGVGGALGAAEVARDGRRVHAADDGGGGRRRARRGRGRRGRPRRGGS